MPKEFFKIKALYINIFVLMFLIAPFFASAQSSKADISIDITPKIPKPLQNVNVSVSSFSSDLDKADISWTLDGRLELRGVGKKNFSFRTNETGNPSTVDVDVSLGGVPALSKRVIIQPGEVDLLWQAVDSYVPRFYRGKALPVSESKIKVVAIPNIKNADGVRLKENDFSFKWKKGYDPVQNASGFGKNSFIYKNSYLDTVDNIGVAISSLSAGNTAEGNVSITPGQPKILLYKKDPFFGIKHENTLSSFLDLNEPTTIAAEPYFFSADNKNINNLKYDWSINGKRTNTSNINELSITLDKNSGGNANIGIVVENASKLFQKSSVDLNINF